MPAAMFATKVGDLLTKLDAYCALNGSAGFAVGTTLSLADLAIAAQLAFMGTGFWDGVPSSVFDSHRSIQAVRKSVHSLPAVAAHYAGRAKMTPFETYLHAAKDF